MKKASPQIQVQPRGPKTRRSSGLMALEQRFMFDGAAMVDAVDKSVDLSIDLSLIHI